MARETGLAGSPSFISQVAGRFYPNGVTLHSPGLAQPWEGMTDVRTTLKGLHNHRATRVQPFQGCVGSFAPSGLEYQPRALGFNAFGVNHESDHCEFRGYDHFLRLFHGSHARQRVEFLQDAAPFLTLGFGQLRQRGFVAKIS